METEDERARLENDAATKRLRLVMETEEEGIVKYSLRNLWTLIKKKQYFFFHPLLLGPT